MSEGLTTTSAEASAQRRLASIAALAAIVAVLVGGGWGAYQAMVRGAPKAIGTDFQADPIRSWERRRPTVAAAPQQPVTVAPGQVVTVRAGGLVMTATGRANGVWRLNFSHRGGGPAPDPQAVALLNHRRTLVEAKSPRADLKLTDAQKSALAAMPSNPPELAQAAADRAVELCKQLVKLPAADAKGTPLKQELEQIVTAVAKADRNAIVATYAERANQVRQILSPEQVQLLLEGRPAQKPPATPKPAVAPKPAAPPAGAAKA